MKIAVDYDLCEANGLCEAMAPAHFELDDDDMLNVLKAEVDEDQRSAVERAVAACPRAAITLED